MAVSALEPLPPPGPCLPEIHFRRLLLHCEQRTGAEPPTSGRPADASGDWRTDPKFHCYVDTLQEQLYDLDKSSTAERPAPHVLEQYKAHVKALSDALRPASLPAFCRPLSAADRQVAAGGGAGGGSASSTLLRTPGAAERLASARTPAAAATPGGGPPGAGQSARDRLLTQRQLQDDLTSELLDMTQDLKAGALAMQNAIRYRGGVVEDADEALDESLVRTQAAAAKAKQQVRRGRFGFCRSLLILLAAALIFVVMLVYIRTTAMVGLGKAGSRYW